MFNPFRKKESPRGDTQKKVESKNGDPEDVKKEAPPAVAPALVVKEGTYPLGVLIVPRITEKATMAGRISNQYVFEVSPVANAYQIRHAVEGKYGVHVKGVNIVNHHGKRVRLGRYEGRRPGFKKAYVTIAKGEIISLTKEH